MNAAILDAIDQVSKSAAGQNGPAELAFRVERMTKDAPVVLEIAPIADTSRQLDAVPSGAIILLIDPDRVPPLDISTFGRLFGLTKAEQEVCGLMVIGHSTKEIADIRNTTPHTAASQVKSILSKTSSRGRVELVRLIGRTLPPLIEKPEPSPPS